MVGNKGRESMGRKGKLGRGNRERSKKIIFFQFLKFTYTIRIRKTNIYKVFLKRICRNASYLNK